MNPTHGSLFTGIGGFELGFHEAGFDTLWMSEIDKFCNKVLEKRFPEVPNLGDVSAVTAPAYVNVLTFGSPCQDLSVAGQRRGLEGSRSGLFFEAARIIEQCCPDFAVWENVPGAFSSNAGRDFAAVLGTLRDVGAVDIAWRVFDSQYAGVPQQRRRVYLVADFRAERAAEILFEPEGCDGHPAPSQRSWQSTAGPVAGGAYGTGRRTEDDPNLVVSPAVSLPLLAHHPRRSPDENFHVEAYGGMQGPRDSSTTLTAHGTRLDMETETFVMTGGATHALTSEGADASEDGTGRGTPIAFTPRLRDGPRDGPTGGMNPLKVSPTLQSDTGGAGNMIPHVSTGSMIRRFTPLECERLQAFPDGWTCLCGIDWSIDPEAAMHLCKCADGPRYRAIGNAVTTRVPAWIARRMLPFLLAD